MSYSDIKHWERPVVGRMIETILMGGNSVSINDSEEWTVTNSTDIDEIHAALFTSDEDVIAVHGPDGTTLGSFYLIYNNGSEHDPMVVISDYSANDYCEAMWNSLNTEFENGVDAFLNLQIVTLREGLERIIEHAYDGPNEVARIARETLRRAQ